MRRENFNKLIFNPYELTDEEVHDAAENTKLFDVLGGKEGIVGSPHTSISRRAKHIRYLLYLYDRNSPLWQSDPDILSRKKKSASLAGYDILNEPEGRLEELYDLKDTHFAHSVVRFIVYQNSATLGALITTEHVLYNLQKRLLEPMEDFKDDKQEVDSFKTKMELINKQGEALAKIEEYKSMIWQEDKAAYEATMEVEYGRKVTPEQIAFHGIKVRKIDR